MSTVLKDLREGKKVTFGSLNKGDFYTYKGGNPVIMKTSNDSSLHFKGLVSSFKGIKPEALVYKLNVEIVVKS